MEMNFIAMILYCKTVTEMCVTSQVGRGLNNPSLIPASQTTSDY